MASAPAEVRPVRHAGSMPTLAVAQTSRADAQRPAVDLPRRRAAGLPRRRTPSHTVAHRRTAGLPRRRSPRAWERRGVASDATARRPRRGAAAGGTSINSGSRADVARRLRSSVRPEARRAPSFRAPPTPRQAAHGGAPWRSHAFTARPRRSATRHRRAARLPTSASFARPRANDLPRRQASSRRRTPAPTLAACMGTPGRRVRRDGPAASSGRGGGRNVDQLREPRRRRPPTPLLRSPGSPPRAFVPRAPDAPPSRARRRALALPCVHRASASEFGSHQSIAKLPRRSSARTDAPRSALAVARRVHGNAGAARPTRRPGGLVGARRRAGRRSPPGAAPTPGRTRPACVHRPTGVQPNRANEAAQASAARRALQRSARARPAATRAARAAGVSSSTAAISRPASAAFPGAK
jgi:hypothetical protein